MNQWLTILPFLLLSSFVSKANIDSLIQQRIIIADSLNNAYLPKQAIALLKKIRYHDAFNRADCAMKANYYHKIGTYYYYDYKSNEALTYWQDSALHIRLTCLGPQHEETANSYFVIAVAYRELENKKKEGENFLNAINILESLPEVDTMDLAYKYLQVGILYDEIGDFALAETYLLHTQRYFKDLNISQHQDVAELFKSLGILKIHQKQYEAAISYFQSSIEVYEKLENRDNKQDIADCYQNLGIVYFDQKNYPAAEKTVLRSLKLYQKLEKDIKIGKSYELLGNISKKRKNYTRSLNYFQKSLEFRLKNELPKDIANTYENIADLYAEQNQFNRALEYYQTSISYLVPDMKDKESSLELNIENQLIINKLDLLRVLYLNAETLLARYELNGEEQDIFDAYAIQQKLDTLIVMVRQKYKAPGSKFFLAQQSLPIYESTVKTALKLFEQTTEHRYLEEAYVYGAKNKAIVLLDGLNDFNAKFSGIPESLLLKEKELKKEYSVIESKIFSFIGEAEKDSLKEMNKSRLFEIRRELEKLVDQLEREYPNYYKLKYSIPDLLTIKNIQSSLLPEQAIIEYFVGNEQIFIFTILKNKINYHTIEKPADFYEECQFLQKLSSGKLTFHAEDFRKTANNMFELLLEKPLSDFNSSIERLIIIPDDFLLQISFDNLLYTRAEQEKPIPYLIKKYAIATAYSNQLLFQPYRLQNANQPTELYAGFGLEYNDFTLEGLKLLGSFRNSSNINDATAKLIYSDDEVEEIHKLLSNQGKVWTNDKATKHNFLQNAGKYRILHFAMHGIIDEEVPLNSSLIFFKDADSTDFVLRAAELYALELNTEMVVLSACHTGAGKIVKGEGVRSLARAFAYAGSPSLVASLWSASDYSTKEILVPFYKYLDEGLAKDIALQKAKLDYLNNTSPAYSSPSYWSHLTVVGNTEPIEIKNSDKESILWWIGGGVILGVFVFLVFRGVKG